MNAGSSVVNGSLVTLTRRRPWFVFVSFTSARLILMPINNLPLSQPVVRWNGLSSKIYS